MVFTSENSARESFKTTNSSETKILACIYLIDKFLDLEKLDSCQYWLNNGQTFTDTQQPTFLHYLLQTRQTEIYYYGRLFELGHLSNQKSLQIAQTIRDSLCEADANHFAGLLYMAGNDLMQAVNHFKKAVGFINTKNFSPAGKYLIKFYNISNNLAKAYIKLGKLDSAVQQLNISAKKINYKVPGRGLANYYYLLGKIHASKNNFDSALLYYNTCIGIAKEIKNVDVELGCYTDKAAAYKKMNNIHAAVNEINKGLDLYRKNKVVNVLFSKEFFTIAIQVYKLNDKPGAIIGLYEKMFFLDSISNLNNTTQAQYILASYFNTEKQLFKIQLQNKDKEQKLVTNQFVIVLLLLLMLTGIALARWYVVKQQLKAVRLKDAISKDLHDDIGASLSSINILGDLADGVWEEQPGKSREMVKKIASQSSQLMERMGDIIWSMKPADEDKYTVEARLKNYCNELLAPKNIVCEFDIDARLAVSITNPEIRKNILLIAKEAINNIAKYSEANKAVILFKQNGKDILLSIRDNGKGYDKEKVKLGNGLQNIQQRCRQLNGYCNISSQNGVLIECFLPLGILK
jgi:signal transduction histidine kinase